jgi:hypothetical protein
MPNLPDSSLPELEARLEKDITDIAKKIIFKLYSYYKLYIASLFQGWLILKLEQY